MSKFISLATLVVGVLLLGCSDNNEQANVDANETLLETSNLQGSYMPSMETIKEYFPVLKIVGGIGYAVYNNDGEINTGLIMTVLNPEGTILANQEKELALLTQMENTLTDIENKLQEIDNELANILNSIELSKDVILSNINDPSEYITNIATYEKELTNLAKTSSPHNANKEELENLKNAILDKSTDGVYGQLNQIHTSIKPVSPAKVPLLKSFTDQLIAQMASSTDIYKILNSYSALEHYSIELIGAESRAVNLLVDALLYNDNNESAKAYNDELKNNIQDIIVLNENGSYSLLYNTFSIILANAEPYYDAPFIDSIFLPEESSDILKRADFVKRRFVDFNLSKETTYPQAIYSGAVIYRISQYNSKVPTYYYSNQEGGELLKCASENFDNLVGTRYDNWTKSQDGELQLDIENRYQATIYNCDTHQAEVGTYSHLKIYDENYEYKFKIPVTIYDANMTENDTANIEYGFKFIYERDSSGFEGNAWRYCNDGYDKYGYGTGSAHYIDSGLEDNEKNPLEHSWMKTNCNEIKDGECHIDSSTKPYDVMSICRDFTYIGTSKKSVLVNTKLYKYINMDSKHPKVTDGDVYGEIHLFIEDLDSSEDKVHTIYKNSHTHSQGENYIHKSTTENNVSFTLLPGHKYSMKLHMSTKIDQGLMNTVGYSHLSIRKKRKIRFIPQ